MCIRDSPNLLTPGNSANHSRTVALKGDHDGWKFGMHLQAAFTAKPPQAVLPIPAIFFDQIPLSSVVGPKYPLAVGAGDSFGPRH